MLSILFVDDEPNVLDGLRRMLRSQRGQWDMHFSDSAEAALDRLATHHTDAVVSDMRMPGMDGAELLSRVRDLYPDTIRIVLSGHSNQEMTLRSIGPAHQYLSKPCDPDQLKETISSALELHKRIKPEEVRRAVESVDSLPILPDVYTKLVSELNDPLASIESAGRIIAEDLGMSAKILQLVNSSFFGMPVRVTDIAHAVALLGVDTVRPLVLSTGIFSQFDADEAGGLSLRRLTAHSTRVGMLAREIAAAIDSDLSASALGDVLLAGMMHDIGRLVLARSQPLQYAGIVAEAEDDPAALAGYEMELYGASHAEIGGYLLQLWGLSSELVEAVALHHMPANSSSDAISPLVAVHVAEALTDSEAVLDESYLVRIGISADVSQWSLCNENLTA